MQSNPKVSVCVTTYNQERYIGECLESIVTQRCNFNFEVIVGEDCSTDNTRAIVQAYSIKYPEIVKPIFHERNVGGEANYLMVHAKAMGEYICIIDGDDLALPGKLQAQSDFLDNTPNCNICFHRVKGLFPDGVLKDDSVEYENVRDGFEKKDLLLFMSVATHSSKMYRKELREFELPNFTVSDFYMNVEQVKDKKACFVDDKCYGIYRMSVGQSTTSRLAVKTMIVNTLERFLVKYPQYKGDINSLYLSLVISDLKNLRDFRLYMHYWIKSFCFNSIVITLKTWKVRRMFRIAK